MITFIIIVLFGLPIILTVGIIRAFRTKGYRRGVYAIINAAIFYGIGWGIGLLLLLTLGSHR